ncbi:RHS repeat-associated core domain-containing protein [Brevundimonas kwangchunensis]|uniref:RHS repeat domain-containing protein n=1 Tax=Brevundimonas kwangchunensis TaxID=322163 RepID=UPI0031DC9EE0
MVTTYNYRTDTQQECYPPDPELDPDGPGWCVADTQGRLQSYQTNTGYMVHYDYASDVGWNTDGWFTVQKVTALNLAVDACAPLAATCVFSRVWPSVTHARPGPWPQIVETDTDQSGRQTTFRRLSGGQLYAIRNPGSSVDDVTVSYVGGGSGLRVGALTDASGAWTYSFTDSGVVRTAVSTGPLGQTTTVVTDLTVGRPSTITDGAGSSFTYQYDSEQRVTRATRPGGAYTQYTYDTRGNVTQTREVARAGSGLADIVTSATYPAGCSVPVTCNSPLTTTDARGGVTDYTWDTTHGGPLTVTAPAPTPGAARPQTRYVYAAQTAYYKNSSGVIAPAPSAVTLPTQINACATGSSCSGGANEVRTTLTYAAPGGANNLQPVAISRGSGSYPWSEVTGVTYTANGDVEYVDGPVSGTADTTRVIYDDARQVVGVIGPGPEGAGAGAHRAQRMTYNPRGQVTVAETGNTAGYSDSNFASFTPVLRSETGYDAYGRPVVTRQQTGAGVTVAASQVSYDAAGRVDCTVVRMNAATFGSLPGSACTAATSGADGPDRITQITYDAAGRPLTNTTAVGQTEATTTSLGYDAHGRLHSMTDGNGNVSVQEYDGFDRPVRLRYPNPSGGGASTTDYTEVGYDPAGNVTSSRNRAGQVTLIAHDNLGRQTLIDAPFGTMDIVTTYDNLGRVLTTSGNGQTLTRTWDALSNMTSEAGPLGTMSYQYDPAGRMTRITWPDSFHVQYDRDAWGAVTAIRENSATSGPGLLAVYGYGDVGQLTGIVRGNGTTSSYGYDAARRMTGMSHDLAGTAWDVVFGYAYNAAGQISARSTSNGAYVYAPVSGGTAYPINGLNQVTSIWSTPVTYDANQNITSGLGRSFHHDAAGRLVGTENSAYSYDPAGRMYGGSASGILLSYAGAQLTGEHDNAGTMLVRHIPGPGLDQPIVTYSGVGLATRMWLANDERQSVINLSDGSGNTLNVNRYDEYGVPAPGNSDRFQYTGQAIIEPGLYNYRNRAYAPQFGRFLQTDPIGYGDGLNVYGYVGGDPVNGIDPWGLQEETTLDDVVVTGRRKCSLFCQIGNLIFPRNPDPAPAHAGGQGSHIYQVESAICSPGGNCTVERVYECLTRYPAPGADGASPVREGSRTYVNVIGVIRGTVTHSVSPETHTVVNSTLPDHTLYPGVVIREVTTSTNWWGMQSIDIQSTGYGTGPNPVANTIPSGAVWQANALQVRECVRSEP